MIASALPSAEQAKTDRKCRKFFDVDVIGNPPKIHITILGRLWNVLKASLKLSVSSKKILGQKNRLSYWFTLKQQRHVVELSRNRIVFGQSSHHDQPRNTVVQNCMKPRNVNIRQHLKNFITVRGKHFGFCHLTSSLSGFIHRPQP